MIEDLLNNSFIKLMLAICSLLGGISAAKDISLIFISNQKLFKLGTQRLLAWSLLITMPIIIGMSGLGMGKFFGKFDIVLFILGLALSFNQYILPTIIISNFRRRNWFLVTLFSLLCIPLLMLCTTFLFSATLSIFPINLKINAIVVPAAWTFFSVLEFVFIVGIFLFSFVLVKSQRKITGSKITGSYLNY